MQDDLSDASVAVTTSTTSTTEQTVPLDEEALANERKVSYQNALVSENFTKVAKRSKAWLLAMNEQASLEPKER